MGPLRAPPTRETQAARTQLGRKNRKINLRENLRKKDRAQVQARADPTVRQWRSEYEGFAQPWIYQRPRPPQGDPGEKALGRRCESLIWLKIIELKTSWLKKEVS